MVPGSTLMEGSGWTVVPRMPRDSRIAARDAAAIPLPREETTPPVTKTYLVIYLACAGMGKFTGTRPAPQTSPGKDLPRAALLTDGALQGAALADGSALDLRVERLRRQVDARALVRRDEHRQSVEPGDEPELPDAELARAGGGADDDHAVGHVHVQAGGRGPAAHRFHAAAVVVAKQRPEVRAADARGGGRRGDAEVGRVAPRQQAGDAAQPSLDEGNGHVVAARLLLVVGIRVDLQLRIR